MVDPNIFRRIADRARRIPYEFGQRNTKTTIRVITYSGPVGMAGVTSTTVDFVLSPRPKVVPLNDEPSVFGRSPAGTTSGRLSADSYTIGPFTKPYPGGQLATIASVIAQGGSNVRVLALLEGDQFSSGGESYAVKDPVNITKGQSFFWTVERTKQP